MCLDVCRNFFEGRTLSTQDLSIISAVGRILPFCWPVLPSGKCAAIAQGAGQNLAELLSGRKGVRMKLYSYLTCNTK